jgi:hypothetical protein
MEARRFKFGACMRWITALTLLCFTTGCMTQQQRAAAVSRDVEDMMLVYGPGCERLGYKSDSDAWRECVLRLATKDQIEQRDFTTTTCFGARRGFLQCGAF